MTFTAKDAIKQLIDFPDKYNTADELKKLANLVSIEAVLRVTDGGVRQGRYGVLTLEADGSYRYALDNDADAVQSLRASDALSEVFHYAASDGVLDSTGTLTITINGSNDLPVTTVDAASVTEDLQPAAAGNVLANDTDRDAGTVLTVSDAGVRHGQYGTLTLRSDGAYNYALDNAAAAVQALKGDEAVKEVFNYTATDGAANVASSLTITVHGSNDAPLVIADSGMVVEDLQLVSTGNVLANDSDADAGSVLKVNDSGVRQGQFGTLTLRSDGSYSYALNNNAAAVQALRSSDALQEVFGYVASDGVANTSGSLTIKIKGNNDAPVAIDDAAATTEDQQLPLTGNLLSNDTDVDVGTILKVEGAGVRAGRYGSLAVDASGAWRYTVDNASAAVQALAAGQTVNESFDYVVRDGDQPDALSDNGVLQIAIVGQNDAPVLVQRLEDKQTAAGAQFSYQFDVKTFKDVDSGDVLRYSATLADGKALPEWLHFDAATRTFSGTVGATTGDLALGLRVTASDLSGAAVTGDFTLTVKGSGDTQCGRVINGTAHDDVLYGTPCNDVIDGKEGHDTMYGGQGDDVYYVDGQGDGCGSGKGNNGVGNGEDPAPPGNPPVNDGPGTGPGHPGNGHGRGYWQRPGALDDPDDGRGTGHTVDDVVEQANAGFDTVFSTASYDMAANVEALRLLGYDQLDGFGNELNNAIFGNGGDNRLGGAAGNDILQGGAGNDTLADTLGNNLLDGGAGADYLTGGSGSEFLAGGSGDDLIVTGGGADVIAFNRGDGQDAIVLGGGRKTLSLGRGITYADLRFAKSKNDLVLMIGANDQITFKDWYTSADRSSLATLQMVIEGTADYNRASSNSMANRKVQQFNFTQLVEEFDQARTRSKKLNNWALSSSLLSFHLGGSDTAALGGDLAYRYSADGNLGQVAIASGQSQLGDSGFGTAQQRLGQKAAPDSLHALM